MYIYYFFATESLKYSREPPKNGEFLVHLPSAGMDRVQEYLWGSKPHCLIWHSLTKHSHVHVNTHFTWIKSNAIQNTSFWYFGIVIKVTFICLYLHVTAWNIWKVSLLYVVLSAGAASSTWILFANLVSNIQSPVMQIKWSAARVPPVSARERCLRFYLYNQHP